MEVVEHTNTLRHPIDLHSTTLEGMIEEKRTPGRFCNKFIKQIKKDRYIESTKTNGE